MLIYTGCGLDLEGEGGGAHFLPSKVSEVSLQLCIQSSEEGLCGDFIGVGC